MRTNPSPDVWAASCLIPLGTGPEGEGQERSEDREEGLGWGQLSLVLERLVHLLGEASPSR